MLEQLPEMRRQSISLDNEVDQVEDGRAEGNDRGLLECNHSNPTQQIYHFIAFHIISSSSSSSSLPISLSLSLPACSHVPLPTLIVSDSKQHKP